MKKAISRRKFIEEGIFRPGVMIAMAGFTMMSVSACSGGSGNKEDVNDPGGADDPAGAGGGATDADPAGGDPCSDLSEVSEAEIQKRESFGYVEQSPIPDKQCHNCNLWLPPGGDHQCGACTLFKGPVKDEAYCTYWAPQV